MNKQQLASKIWESANKMRSKIEANEYKDYILGFMFYKFLSDKEVDQLKKEGWTKEDMKEALVEEDEQVVGYCQKNFGYFIAYKNLFSTWLEMGKDFDVSNVRDALSAFNRLISDTHKKVFEKIFNTLDTGLSKLGDNSGAQTKAISDLIQLIKVIPTDGRQDYDVIGFIYEYLISNFAANAGKKAGEFYTPHEVSLLMSEIVADHLKNREKIEIYDPTSGSGSLLINIGHSVAKRMGSKDNIKYYAQELKENTYNLTRMNLVMRGILPSNICTRNGDTLEEDWPYFDDADPTRTYEPLYVDAVVSNPPYSQAWDPTDKDSDPRYQRYGLAPKTKADYAFLLHDLYHIKPDGIMTIVLPHGVLFRGGEEEKIRKQLIENNNIDAIIGLPANIFFGTGIPTIIMVLKQRRPNTDVLIIDASKGFVKAGKNNKLRACDIKKIADTVVARTDVPKYARKVSRDEIRANGYNLNIPRYVDSSEKGESWDIYASIFGGIPKAEIDELQEYWDAFPSLKSEIFAESDTPFSAVKTEDVGATISGNSDVQDFAAKHKVAFADFEDFLQSELIEKMAGLYVSKEEAVITEDVFARLSGIPLIDKYVAYQLLDDDWTKIETDLEIIQTEGFEATKKVDPRMVLKKEKGKDVEVQDGWIGHVIPFEIVQSSILKTEADEMNALTQRQTAVEQELTDLIDLLPEDEKESVLLNEDNTSFVATEVSRRVKELIYTVESPAINVLNGYLKLNKKSEKLGYIANHPEIEWAAVPSSKDGTYGKFAIEKLIALEITKIDFDEESIESIILKANELISQEKELKAQIKKHASDLHNLTKATIENLTDEQVKEMLCLKWIKPLADGIAVLPDSIVSALTNKINTLTKKYSVTLLDVEAQIDETEKAFADMIDDLEGSEFDMKGLKELQKMLKGE